MKRLSFIILFFTFLFLFTIFSCGEKDEIVKEKKLEKIELLSNPKTIYYQNEEMDLNDGIITAYFSDDTTKDILLTKEMISNFDTTVIGYHNLLISYTYQDITKTAILRINVIKENAEEVKLVSIDARDGKNVYYEGDSFDNSTLIVTAHYSDSSSKRIYSYSWDKTILSRTDKYVTITYQGLTYNYNITVNPPIMTDLEINKYPIRLAYNEGEKFDPTGLELKAYYNNNQSEIITDFTYSTDNLTINDHEIIISYNDYDLAIPIKVAGVNNYQEVITAIANSFYLRGNQIQYDQSNRRRQLNSYPEMASSDEITFLDCSSFTNSVYHYAFDINIVPSGATTADFNNYLKNYAGNDEYPDALCYYVNNEIEESNQTKVLADVKSMLEVGDLVVYRHGATSGSSGHVMMYIGNNMFIHSTGSSFNYNSDPFSGQDAATAAERDGGTVQLLKASEVFENKSSSRYLFKKTTNDSIFSFGVIRPLNRKNLKLTRAAIEKFRLENVVINRSSDINLYNSVKKDDYIEYNISLVNKGTSTIHGIYINEYLSNLTTYQLDEYEGYEVIYDKKLNQLRINIENLDVNEQLDVKYRVKVSSDSGIITSTSDVNMMMVKPINHTIQTISDNSLNKFKTSAASLINSSATSSLDIINNLYLNNCGKKFTNLSTISDLMDDLIDPTVDGIKEDSVSSKMIVPNLFGGLSIKEGMLKDIYRSRRVMIDYLMIGDIIVIYNSNKTEYSCYLYYDNNKFITVSGGKVIQQLNGSTLNSCFTTQLIGFSKYVVIRPSMVK